MLWRREIVAMRTLSTEGSGSNICCTLCEVEHTPQIVTWSTAISLATSFVIDGLFPLQGRGVSGRVPDYLAMPPHREVCRPRASLYAWRLDQVGLVEMGCVASVEVAAGGLP